MTIIFDDRARISAVSTSSLLPEKFGVKYEGDLKGTPIFEYLQLWSTQGNLQQLQRGVEDLIRDETSFTQLTILGQDNSDDLYVTGQTLTNGSYMLQIHDLSGIGESERAAAKAEMEKIEKVAHSLRSPMVSAGGWVRRVKELYDEAFAAGSRADRDKFRKKGDEAITMVVDSCDRFLSRGEEVLNGRRASYGIEDEKVQRILLVRDIVKPLLDLYSSRVTQKGIVVSYDLSADEQVIRAKPSVLQPVCADCVDNCIKHVHPKGKISYGVEFPADAPGFIDIVFFNTMEDRHIRTELPGYGIGHRIHRNAMEAEGGNLFGRYNAARTGYEQIIRLPILEQGMEGKPPVSKELDF